MIPPATTIQREKRNPVIRKQRGRVQRVPPPLHPDYEANLLLIALFDSNPNNTPTSMDLL